MTQNVVGLFDSHEKADQAVRVLEQAGIGREQISVLARNRVIPTNIYAEKTEAKDVAESSGAGALLGGAAGGLIGLLAGVGAIAIPGLGPAIAAGSLAAALGIGAGGAGVGAAVGGILGAMTALNIPKDDAAMYAEGVRRGGILVIVQAGEPQAGEARRALDDAGALDINSLEEEIRKKGWDRFEDEEPV